MFRTILLTVFLSISLTSFANNWEQLFDHPSYQQAKISPDGKHLAIAVMSKDKRSLIFVDTNTLKLVGSAKLSGTNHVGDYYWANNERVVIKVTEKEAWLREPQFYGELFAVDLTGKNSKFIYGYRSGEYSNSLYVKKQEQTLGWADIIDTLPEDEEHILISSTKWNKSGDRKASIHKLNIYNGQLKNQLARSPISYADFVTDESGQVVVATGTNENNEQQVFIRRGKEWHEIDTSMFGQNFVALSVDSDSEYLYTLDNFKQDNLGLFRLHLKTLKYESIFAEKGIDITQVKQTVDGRSIYAARIDKDYPTYHVLNDESEEAAIFGRLLATFPQMKLDITSHSSNGERYVFRVSSDVEPGSFYLYDKALNKLKFLFEYFPKLKKKQLIGSHAIQFTAQDGTTINGYYTPSITVNDTSQKAPLILLVHGGPHARDYWGYSAQTQYLAQNGYSVLQVNFRGSSGYGTAFMQAGYKNWGTVIQQDINDGLKWAITQGIADKDRVCIMGASFGAYSAVQSAVTYPEDYKCAIANAGIYDLAMMFELGDITQYGFGSSYLEMTLGTDKTQLKAQSPIHNLDNIKAPLFLAHGKKDKRAPFKQVVKLKEALDKHQKTYSWFAIDNESHGFYEPETQKRYMREVLSFLKTHLK